MSVPVPEKDGYTVELVLSSLPDGLALIDENKSIAVITKDAFTTSSKKVTFFTGDAGETVVGVAGLAAIIFAVTGTILWWRTRRTPADAPVSATGMGLQ